MITKDERDYLLYCGIYERYFEARLDDFKGDVDDLQMVKNYLRNIDRMKKLGIGLFLYGDNGVGKTFLMNASMIEIIKAKKGYSVYLITFAELAKLCMDSWKDEEAKEFYTRIINADFLGIDEINKTETASYDRHSSTVHVSILEGLLRYRSLRLKPTWFTSNVPTSEIAERYSISIHSLLKETSRVLHLHGTDYRDTLQDKIIDSL